MNNKRSKSGLFLTELMIAVLFFALCACVCLSMFVRSYLMSVESSDTTNAIIAAQQAAECIKADPDTLVDVLGGEKADVNNYIVYYDNDWNVIDDYTLMRYEMKVEVNHASPLLSAVVSIYKDYTNIYEVEVKKYNG